MSNTSNTTGSISLPNRLERIETKQDEMLEALTGLRLEIAVVKTKAAIWAAVWGGLASLVIGAIVSKVLG